MDWKSVQDRSYEQAKKSGWTDKPISLGEACALLHSEVSEALEAYRERRLEAWHHPADNKPEGVGSELADVAIRLGHYSTTFGVSLWAWTAGNFSLLTPASFPIMCAVLHAQIAAIFSQARMNTTTIARHGPWESQFGCVADCTLAIATHLGIDLAKCVDEKLAYNATRPYRHGNKEV